MSNPTVATVERCHAAGTVVAFVLVVTLVVGVVFISSMDTSATSGPSTAKSSVHQAGEYEAGRSQTAQTAVP